LILCAIVVVFGGLIVLYTFVGSYQNRKIDEFTQEAPMELVTVQPDGAAVQAANEKLAQIAKAVADQKSERVLFTPQDLNVLIATLDALKDFRGQTYIDHFSPDGIVAEMSQPMRKGVFKKGFRYLNATFVLEPEVRAQTVAFKVIDIRPKEGAVPKGFVQNYKVLDFFRLDPKNEQIKAHIKSILAVYTEGDHLVVETGVRQVEGE
tara:strand:+ start:1428 stop:2048 length:621 start_codon:yes stop_codon:yes gene_type:complete